ncbi:glycosyltransferase family 9 protein (plasmid) [Thalassobaculum sp. OXR-137]|uniref:glycosyltransferase family 9 protein n=1 Tax=Thalassobaculum sp. OXR-137 TaxID=3100173 RepID=UPI002AC94DF7|nr:glycosyltransferase family 9 protein [Thalassobaculum sp. OXR-137]WPZ37229.1 glycosyltransferase family 9 protein [Thalassobaculum sp. OXR-137]
MLLSCAARAIAAGAGLARHASVLCGNRGDRTAIRRPKIAILSYEHQLGSIIATTPVFSALRQLRPDAEITVFGTALLGQILRSNPNVDRFVVTADPHDHPLRAIGDIVAMQLGSQTGPFDWLLATVGCRRGLIGIMAAALPSGRRAGHTVADFASSYAFPIPYDDQASMVANNLRILSPLGLAPEQQEPAVFFDPPTAGRVRDLLETHGIDPDRRIAVLALETSGGQPTQWFADRAAEVADRLSREANLQIVLVGTETGQVMLDEVRGLMSTEAVSLAGRTSVPELAALFAMADLAVALDTGAMHVARAAGVPLVVVASAWQPPHLWLPIDVAQASIVSRHGSPGLCCQNVACRSRDCMRSISAKEVVTAAFDLLGHYPPSNDERRRRCAALTVDQ